MPAIVRLITAIIAAAAVVVRMFGPQAAPKPGPTTETGTVSQLCYQETCFDIDIVDTPASRSQGLMNRSSIPANYGMLFVFDQAGNYSFWMKNTLIKLDMIWMDEHYRILEIVQNAEPCTQDPCPVYGGSSLAAYTLEINGGLAKVLGMEIGESMSRH